MTLTALTLLVIALIVLLFLVFLKSREMDRLKQILGGTIKNVAALGSTHVCLYKFGYLRSYPKGKPIPSECMGCSDIFECLAHRKKKPKTTKKKTRKRKTKKVTKATKKKRR